MASIMGGLGGAASGAAAGTAILPGIGTAIGGLVGGLSGLFGGGDSDKPQMAPLVQGATAQDATAANAQQQAILAQQQAFVNALQSQGTQGMGSQTALGTQLLNQTQGIGPNPAQAALAQSTGANVANQAALMAGQRGAGANAGLIARQAAMQGANTQQQAVGQSATLQAQQQLAAQQQLQSLAASQVGQQQAGLGQLQTGSAQNQSNVLGAIGNYNSALTAGQGSVNTAQTAQNDLASQQQGGLMSGLGTAATALGNAFKPDKTPLATAGGATTPVQLPASNMRPTAATGGLVTPGQIGSNPPAGGMHPFLSGWASQTRMAKGGEVHKKVPALVSPGEIYLPPDAAKKVAEGKASPSKVGQKIPGKAAVAGDSYDNDTVKRTLEAGGFVIPRHAMSDEASAAAFVKAHFKGRK